MPLLRINRYIPNASWIQDGFNDRRVPLQYRDNGPQQPPILRGDSSPELFAPDVIYPDGVGLVREAPNVYRERLSGIVLTSNIKELQKKNKQKGSLRTPYRSTQWKIVFPITGIELNVPSRKEGIKIIWEYREAIKNVMERYFVSSRGPNGRIFTFIPNFDPINHAASTRVRKVGAASSPVFLACV